MYLDITKKVGDTSAIKTEAQLIKELQQKVKDLEEKMEIFVKALIFYAEPWNDDPDNDYNYETAREALKELP